MICIHGIPFFWLENPTCLVSVSCRGCFDACTVRLLPALPRSRPAQGTASFLGLICAVASISHPYREEDNEEKGATDDKIPRGEEDNEG